MINLVWQLILCKQKKRRWPTRDPHSVHWCINSPSKAPPLSSLPSHPFPLKYAKCPSLPSSFQAIAWKEEGRLGHFAYLRGKGWLGKEERGGAFEGEFIHQCTLCGSRVGHLLFFCLHRISCHTRLIILIAWNPRYLHFAVRLFLWLLKLKSLTSPLGLFQASYVILRGWKGDFGAPNHRGTKIGGGI